MMVPQSGPVEISQLNSTDQSLPSSSSKQDQKQSVGPRVSERLRFKSKLIESKRKANPPPPRPPPGFEEEVKERDIIDKASRSIEVGNPAHKLLFITYLGLVPKSDAKIPPYIHLKRLPDSLVASSKTSSSSSQISSAVLNDELEYSDIEDLDLELVFCPLDIPEIYEEITKKRFPNSSSSPTDEVCSSNSESGYESSSTGTEFKFPSSPVPPVVIPSKRIHYAYKSTAGIRPPKRLQSSIPLIEIVDDDQCSSKTSRVIKAPAITVRRSVRIPTVKQMSIFVKGQTRAPPPPRPEILVKHRWSVGGMSGNVFRTVPRPVLGPTTQHPQYSYQAPNFIDVIKKRLLALHTDLTFINE